ncbi:hypothetical protein AVEN_1446-1 [Araneus ventricosus]|uniref:Uncharacterized protein n=1 Tax=Araneus ventricosus TaxID=182803 RepID=A0A4Y2IN93_ARAVE|nr:hypothetical protein AVEN_1446-1 [Araneus ventricosus]
MTFSASCLSKRQKWFGKHKSIENLKISGNFEVSLLPACVFVLQLNSIDTGTSLQVKDGDRPNITAKFQPLSLSVTEFILAARPFFVRVACSDGFGEEWGFLRIRTVQLSL